MRLFVIVLCLLSGGCASMLMQTNQNRQTIEVYDNNGDVKEHVIIKDNHITIYDKDWKTKGYGTVKP